MQQFAPCDAPITHVVDYEGLLADHGVVTCVKKGLKLSEWKPIIARPEGHNMLNRRLKALNVSQGFISWPLRWLNVVSTFE